MEEDREYKDTVQKLFTFIEESPSQYHAVDTMRKHLEAAGYEQLLESGAWKLKSGGKYYVIRSGSSLIAFRIPAQDSQNYCGFQIVASHSDSPSFKIKTNPEMNVEEHYVKLNVEKYGGMLCAPWFDRPRCKEHTAIFFNIQFYIMLKNMAVCSVHRGLTDHCLWQGV